MKWIAMAALMVMLLPTARSDDFCTGGKSTVLMGPSWHSKGDINGHKVYGDTPGLGVGCRDVKGTDWSLYAGVYRNSFHDVSVYNAGIWRGGIIKAIKRSTGIDAGIGIGLVSGYDDDVVALDVGGIAPMAFIDATLFSLSGLKFGVLVLPPGEKDGAWVTNLHAEIDF